MKISLIIPFYKRIDFLRAIFSCLEQQTFQEFEVIIAEDNDDEKTVLFLQEMRNKHTFSIKHIQQQDDGFRKNMAMNKAVAKAIGELLVFIDGDCLPHPHFFNEYAAAAKQGVVLWGRRVMLSKQLTNQLLKDEEQTLPKLHQIIASSSTKKEEAIYSKLFNKLRRKERNLKGCNWGILKQDFLSVNGFDEDYTLATTGEDDDIDWRLKQAGFQKQSLKNLAILYHLHHPANYDNTASITNKKMMQTKQAIGNAYAENGIDKYL